MMLFLELLDASKRRKFKMAATKPEINKSQLPVGHSTFELLDPKRVAVGISLLSFI